MSHNGRQMRQRSFFLRTNIQFQNLGDLLINRELVKLASQHGRVFIHKGKCPKHFVQTLLKSRVIFITFSWVFFVRMLSEQLRNKNCFYFLCPGGMSGQLTLYNFLIKMSGLPIIYLLRAFGVRVVQLGVSFSEIEPLMGAYLRMRSLGVFALYVRDAHSLEQLARHRVPNKGILPDLAFNVFESESQRRNCIQNIVISFRSDQDSGQFERIVRFVDRLVACLPEGGRIVILAQVLFDVDGMRRVHDRLMASGKRTELVINCDDIDENIRIMRGCDVVFSNRLHVLLLGASQGVRMVACIDHHDKKIRGLFSTIGLHAAVLDLSSEPTRSMVETATLTSHDGQVEARQLREAFTKLVSA